MELMKKVFNSEIKAIDEKEMTLTASISSNAVDRMGEVLDPNGVDLKNYRNNPVVLWAHDYSLPPIGKALWVKRDGETIISKVQFAKTDFAQEIFQLYKEGYMKAFSVGFQPKDFIDGDGKKQPYRTYTKWELLEFSAVPVPANPEALALAMQKGFLKSDSLKALIKQEEPVQEFDNEFKKVVEIVSEKKEVVPVVSAYDDLIAENDVLNKKVESLEKENSDLKYKLFTLLTKIQKRFSEITAQDAVDKLEDVVSRVIRKHQGKID